MAEQSTAATELAIQAFAAVETLALALADVLFEQGQPATGEAMLTRFADGCEAQLPPSDLRDGLVRAARARSELLHALSRGSR